MNADLEPSNERGCLIVGPFIVSIIGLVFDNQMIWVLSLLVGILIVVNLSISRSPRSVLDDLKALRDSQFGNSSKSVPKNGTATPVSAHAPVGSASDSSSSPSNNVIDLSAKLADFWLEPRVYTLKLAMDTRWNADQSITLITKLAHLGDLILRIVATPQEIVWQLIDVNEQPNPSDEVTRAVRAAYLDVEVSAPELLEKIAVNEEHWRRVDYYHQEQEWPRPSLRAGDIKKSDPLTAIVNSLVDLRDGERISYLLAFGAPREETEFAGLIKIGVESITKSKAGAVALGVLDAAFSQGNWGKAIGAGIGAGIAGTVWGGRPDKYPPDIMKACVEKLADTPPIRCFVVVEANSPSRDRLNQFNFFLTFVKQISTEFQTFTTTSDVEIQVTREFEERKSNSVLVLTNLLRSSFLPLDKRANVLVTPEIAALWHLPHEAMTANEIAWLKGKQVPAPVEFRGERAGVQLGINKPTKAAIYQPLRERTVHTLIIGKTGTGKTSLMHGMIAQDIQVGHGVAVIDPVGNLVRRILQHSIPKEREDDVVVLDIDFEFQRNGAIVRYPPPMNLTSMPAGVERSQVAFQFASVLGKLYSDIDQSRWMQTLEAALLTVAADDTPTLMDVRRVIQDVSYRNQLLAKLDFSVTQMWEDIEISGGLDKTSIGSIIWRLGRFTSNPTLQAVTCHPKPLNLADQIGKNKIILVSVSADESKVPESARNVLGAIILSQIQMAVLGGAVKDPKNKPFMLYVDEVQNFVSSSLDVIARQARQKGLGLVVTTQYTKSIAPKTLKALEGNIGTLVAFECDMDDAESAISLMPSFSAKDLVNVGRFKAAISMRSGDSANRASFSIDPVSAPDVSSDPSSLERELYLREKSVATYTPVTYDEVKSWLAAKYRSQETQAKNEDDDAEFGNPITT